VTTGEEGVILEDLSLEELESLREAIRAEFVRLADLLRQAFEEDGAHPPKLIEEFNEKSSELQRIEDARYVKLGSFGPRWVVTDFEAYLENERERNRIPTEEEINLQREEDQAAAAAWDLRSGYIPVGDRGVQTRTIGTDFDETLSSGELEIWRRYLSGEGTGEDGGLTDREDALGRAIGQKRQRFFRSAYLAAGSGAYSEDKMAALGIGQGALPLYDLIQKDPLTEAIGLDSRSTVTPEAAGDPDRFLPNVGRTGDWDPNQRDPFKAPTLGYPGRLGSEGGGPPPPELRPYNPTPPWDPNLLAQVPEMSQQDDILPDGFHVKHRSHHAGHFDILDKDGNVVATVGEDPGIAGQPFSPISSEDIPAQQKALANLMKLDRGISSWWHDVNRQRRYEFLTQPPERIDPPAQLPEGVSWNDIKKAAGSVVTGVTDALLTLTSLRGRLIRGISSIGNKEVYRNLALFGQRFADDYENEVQQISGGVVAVQEGQADLLQAIIGGIVSGITENPDMPLHILVKQELDAIEVDDPKDRDLPADQDLIAPELTLLDKVKKAEAVVNEEFPAAPEAVDFGPPPPIPVTGATGIAEALLAEPTDAVPTPERPPPEAPSQFPTPARPPIPGPGVRELEEAELRITERPSLAGETFRDLWASWVKDNRILIKNTPGLWEWLTMKEGVKPGILENAKAKYEREYTEISAESGEKIRTANITLEEMGLQRVGAANTVDDIVDVVAARIDRDMVEFDRRIDALRDQLGRAVGLDGKPYTQEQINAMDASEQSRLGLVYGGYSISDVVAAFQKRGVFEGRVTVQDFFESEMSVQAVADDYSEDLADEGWKPSDAEALFGHKMLAFREEISRTRFDIAWPDMVDDISSGLRPHIASWMHTPAAQDSMRALFVRHMESLSFPDIAPTRDPKTYLLGLPTVFYNHAFAKQNVTEATHYRSISLLDGLPSEVVNVLGPILSDMSSKDFRDQLGRAGGIEDQAAWLDRWKPDPSDVDFLIQKQSPMIGQRLGITLGIQRLSREDPLAALSAASDVVRQSLGGEDPTLSQILEELSRVGGKTAGLAGFPGFAIGRGDETRLISGGQIGTRGGLIPNITKTFADFQREQAAEQRLSRTADLESLLGLEAGSGFDLELLEEEARMKDRRELASQLDEAQPPGRQRTPFGKPVFTGRF
jgi:hypothetical protein